MAYYTDLITQLSAAGAAPFKTIDRSCKSTAKEAFGCFPPRIPEELVYAAGFLPVQLWGGRTELAKADRYLQGFCCTVMRANLELALRGGCDMLRGVIIPTLCDSLKCVLEDWKEAVPHIPCIGVVYPQNRTLPEGRDYMAEEFKRICDELGVIRGRKVTEAEVELAFEVYEAWRAAMRDFEKEAVRFPVTLGAKTRHLVMRAAQFMDKAQYTEMIVALTAELKKLPDEPFTGLRVIPTGLMAEPLYLLDLFEENSISFVGDDLSQGSRLFRTPARQQGNVWQRMAAMIADIEGDTFLYDPYKSKGNMLRDLVKERKANAVVVLMTKFCDPEEFDYPILKEAMEKEHIPLLYLETDQQADNAEQLRTRIQSFGEMLL